MSLFESITNLQTGADALARRRYGVIETIDGQLSAVHFRPFPKIISLPEALWLGRWHHRFLSGNRCWLYYNQPLGHSNFLAIKYMISARDCTFATARAAMTVLEEIARLKRSDAALCDVSNRRISARLLAREGWEQHCLSSPRRHFIKRYYGQYPPPAKL